MPSDVIHVPMSVLDLAPVAAGTTAGAALRHTTELARRTEELGYRRFWVAEHHNMPAIASSAPAVLLAHVAAATSRIRVGSGGVMLPNHSTLMVAEYYGTLHALYGDRFDLGLGRAPGTDPLTSAALARRTGQLDTFAQDVLELIDYLGDPRPEAKVRALPGEGTKIPLWMLGSSTGGAQVAAVLGLPFAFASHFAPQQMREALDLYRAHFRADAPTAQVDRPTVMAGINVLVAPTQAEAEYLFTTSWQMVARVRTGRPGPLDPPVAELTAVVAPEVLTYTAEFLQVRAVGTAERVVAGLEDFVAAYDLDELIITTYTYDPALRRRSFELLAEAWGIAPR